jgi:DNA-binding MarR family transcriptional regulator
MDKVAVSRAVGTLLRTARLERRTAHADRRRSVLRLTSAGRQVHAGVAPFALAYERALVKPLSRAERAALDRSLDILLGRAVQIGPLAKR